MPGSLSEELIRILSHQKANGIRQAWLSEANARAFFYSVPGLQTLKRPAATPPSVPSSASSLDASHTACISITTHSSVQSTMKQEASATSQYTATPPSSAMLTMTTRSTGTEPATVTASADGMSWDDLQAAALSCQSCPLYAGRHHVVIEDGFREARVMFIGEGPGEEEDRQGIPFVGRAGQLLTKMILAMGLDRNSRDAEHGCYIANIVKCRPPANRNPEPEEGQACLHFLKRQIQLVHPQVIVLLGAVPLNFLMNRRGITALRGKWLNYDGIPVMPTFHPAYLLRFERNKEQFVAEKRKVWSDLQQVMALVGLQRPVSTT